MGANPVIRPKPGSSPPPRLLKVVISTEAKRSAVFSAKAQLSTKTILFSRPQEIQLQAYPRFPGTTTILRTRPELSHPTADAHKIPRKVSPGSSLRNWPELAHGRVHPFLASTPHSRREVS